MGVVKEVRIKIKGNVDDDYRDRDYEILVAELKVITTRYGLELEEEAW